MFTPKQVFPQLYSSVNFIVWIGCLFLW